MEEWRVVEGFSRYEVSNTGKVREIESLREIPQPVNGGFCCVNLYETYGKKVLAKVHRLVAIAFIPNAQGVKMVEHKGDRLVNDVNNLRWRPKVIKEVVEKEVETLTFLNNTYTYPEFCGLAGCEISNLRYRLKAGWSVRECFTGIKEFTGSGYQDEFSWYPSRDEFDSVAAQQRIEKRANDKEEKNKQNAIKRAEREAKIHHGFGVFVNYPIKGIEGRKPLRAYFVWQGIIARCYNPEHDSYLRYGGRGCTVNIKWKHFQDFAVWYQEQQKRGIGNAHVNWHVDKDILVDGNLEYGPDTCAFVPDAVNIFFAGITEEVKGYSYFKGKWVSSVSTFNVKHQRCFNTEDEARSWYLDGKTQAAQFLIWKYSGLLDQRVVDKLSQI